jgi:hypothetical protein
MEDITNNIKETALRWMLNGILKINGLRKQLKQLKAENFAGLSSDMIAVHRELAIALKEYDKICRERRKK